MTANIISGMALLVAAGAFVVSWVYGHHNTVAANRSAKAAEASAADAQRVRKAELEREHRDYAPELKDVNFAWETNTRSKQLIQFMTFTLTRSYRVFGDTLHPNSGSESRSPLGDGMGGAFEAGKEYRIYVSGETNPPTEVELRFFPPVEGDPGEAWGCPCDRDSVAEVAKKGHWVIRMPVPPRLPTRVRWMS